MSERQIFKACGVLQQILQLDYARKTISWNLQLGRQVIIDRLIQIQLALLHQLHRGNIGKKLRQRADPKQAGIGIYWPLRQRTYAITLGQQRTIRPHHGNAHTS